MRIWIRRTMQATSVALWLAPHPSAQTRPAPPAGQTRTETPPREGSRDESLRRGRRELAAGDAEAAHVRAERLLQLNPADRDAYLLGVDALNARNDRMGALAVYRRFVGPGHEDFVLLSPIARVEIDLLLKHPSPALRQAAQAVLDRMAKEGGDPATPPRDTKTFSTMARDRESPTRRAAGLEALADSESPDAKAAVVDALADPDFRVRMAAINGVIALHAQDAVPQLKTILGDANPLVRVQAASALRRLGDASGDPVLKDALASPFRGGRLVAARALRETGDTTSWVAAVAPMLESEQPIERVMAAELLAGAPAWRDKAQAALQGAMSDENELVRSEASRVITAEPDREAPTPYAALIDDDPWVRLKAAEIVLLSPPVVAARKAAAAAAKTAAKSSAPKR
jgi:HEAT repeat protein